MPSSVVAGGNYPSIKFSLSGNVLLIGKFSSKNTKFAAGSPRIWGGGNLGQNWK